MLEQRADRDGLEQADVKAVAFVVRRQRRSDVRQTQRIELLASRRARNDEEFRRIDRYLGHRQLAVVIRVIVLDRQREVAAGREPFAVLLLAAIEDDRRNSLTEFLDAVV